MRNYVTPLSCLMMLLITASNIYAQDKVALLVGVNTYDKVGLSDKPLKYAERDVEKLGEVLRVNGFTVKVMKGSFKKSNPLRSTKANIENQVQNWLLRDRNANDILLIAFTGHGQQRELIEAYKDDDGKVAYRYAKDSEGVPIEDAYYCPADCYVSELESMISLTSIMKQFGTKGGINLMLVDACRDDPTRSTRSISGNELNGRLPANTGVLFSCAAGQQAYETKELDGGHGVFMYHVIKGLKGDAAGPDGSINWLFLTNYLQTKVNKKAVELFPENASSKKILQTPHGFSNFTNIPSIITPKDLSGSMFKLAEEYRLKKDYKKAIEHYSDAILGKSDYVLAYNNRGIVYHTLGQYDKAFADYNSAISYDDKYYTSYYNRGLIHEINKDYDKAEKDYKTCVSLNPKYAKAYNNLGYISELKKDKVSALKYYNKSVNSDPTYALGYHNRSVFYRNDKDYNTALVDADKSLKLNPDYAPGYSNRGLIHFYLNNMDKAMSDYNKSIELDPSSALVYNNRGLIHERKGDHRKAITEYSLAIQADPNYHLAYNNRGLAYADLGDPGKAIEDHTRAIRIKGDEYGYYYDRGLSYHNLKEYELSVLDNSKAVQLNPNYAKAWYNRGLSNYYLKNYEKTISDNTKAIQIDGTYANAYQNRALAYYMLGKYDNRL